MNSIYCNNNKFLLPNKHTTTNNLTKLSYSTTHDVSEPSNLQQNTISESAAYTIVYNSSNKIVLYKIGSTGDKVAHIQKRLVKYGYSLVIDGIFGRKTQNAVLSFQSRTGLYQDGIVGPNTLLQLEKEPSKNIKYKQYGTQKIDTSNTSKNKPADSKMTNTVKADNLSQTGKALETYVNKNAFTSSTKYFIFVSTSIQKVSLFKQSSKDNLKKWELVKSMACSTGKASTPTVKGNFSVGIKGLYFRVNKNVICKYYTQFYGNYLFHTVLLDNNGAIVDGTLGTPVSHGCIRLAVSDAKYIYDTIPKNTAVFVQ